MGNWNDGDGDCNGGLGRWAFHTQVTGYHRNFEDTMEPLRAKEVRMRERVSMGMGHRELE